MPVIQFAVQSYKSRSLPVSAQRCVNAYAEQEPPDAKTQVAVFGCPGLVNFTTCGTGPVRGMWTMAGVLYVVSGGTLYSVSSTGAATPIGSTISGSGVVSMSDNGTQLMIVNATHGYIYSLTSGFQIITDTDFNPADTTIFFDTYFVLNWKGTNRFFISVSNDGTSYNGLDFASAEVSPDYVVSVVNQQENLLVFGQTTIETWYDAGAVDFPFLRVDGGTIERGCAAALTPVKEDNSVFFLGNDLVFYRLNGLIPVRVSTHALEDLWATYTTVSDAFTFSYTFEGHKFIALIFPAENGAFEYDIATNLWHERESWDQNNNKLGRWRANCHANCYNLNLIGDQYSGQVGYLSSGTFTEFGNTMEMTMVAPHIHSDRKRVYISRFELDIETGTGLNSGQGSDPQVMLDWSRDGGRTYVGPQLWSAMGKIGAYLTRLRWLRLGQARDWVFRIQISDPVKRVIIAAHADIKVGM